MSDPFVLAARHNTWANVRLLEFCGSLSPEQLAWTVPGTYGSIHASLQHIVDAELGYLYRLSGDMATGPLGEERLRSLGELESLARSNGERFERLLAAGLDADADVTRPGRRRATAGVVATQYLHHGSDHRAHIGTILGAHGVEPPILDVWAYGVAFGQVAASS